MSVTTAATEASSRERGRLSTIVVSCLAIVAAIAGLVLGGVYQRAPNPRASPPAPGKITKAGVQLELPSGWAQAGAADLSAFDQAVWLIDGQTRVRAAVALLPAASPSLLPVGLDATGTPETVQLGRRGRAWRYRATSSDGIPLVVYAAPTTKGVATVGCLRVSGGEAERSCRAVAEALTVPGSRRLEPGQRAALFTQLPNTVAGLDAARAKGLRALETARRSTGQALAAKSLARAHRDAVAELGPVSSNGDSLATETVGVLGATASAYAALADAAHARSPKAYAEARGAVTSADDRLRRTMAKVAAAVDTANRAATAAATPAPAPRADADGTAVPATPARGAARVRARKSAPASPAASSGPAAVALGLVWALVVVAVVALVVRARRVRRPDAGTFAGLAGSLAPGSGLAVASGGLGRGSRGAVEDREPVRLWRVEGHEPGGAEGRFAPAGVGGGGVPAPPDRGRGWIAEVEWCHAGGVARFRVLAADAEGTAVAIAESVALEWPPSGPESVQAMSRAADELEAAMLAAGWKPLPPGEAWYAKRFAWPRAAAPRRASVGAAAVAGPEPAASVGAAAVAGPEPAARAVGAEDAALSAGSASRACRGRRVPSGCGGVRSAGMRATGARALRRSRSSRRAGADSRSADRRRSSG